MHQSNRYQLRCFLRSTSLVLSFITIFTAVFTTAFTTADFTPAHASLFSRWRSRFSSAPPPNWGGSRGDGFCPFSLAPAPINYVLSERPTLIWQGTVAKMELWANGGNDEPLWTYPLEESGENNPVNTIRLGERTLYAMPMPVSLMPDSIYEWRVYERSNLEPLKLSLQLLPASERLQVSEQLKQIDRQSAMQSAANEATMLARADYLASEQLWLDFWQEMMQAPSTEIRNVIDATITDICAVE